MKEDGLIENIDANDYIEYDTFGISIDKSSLYSTVLDIFEDFKATFIDEFSNQVDFKTESFKMFLNNMEQKLTIEFSKSELNSLADKLKESIRDEDYDDDRYESYRSNLGEDTELQIIEKMFEK